MFRYKSIYSVLFLTCICNKFCASADISCPPEELLTPCKCYREMYSDRLTVKCSDFTNVMDLENIFLKVHNWNVQDFILENLTMQYVPSVIFEHINVWNVTIQKSTLLSLFDKPLRPHSMDFYVDGVKLLRGFDFSLCRDLVTQKFAIYNGDIKSVGKSFKAGMTEHVTFLWLVNTKTKRIMDGAFENLKQLSVLTISDNRLKTLKRNYFARPSPMFSLDFSKNKISSLPVDLVDDMPDLKMLMLHDNPILTLSENIFRRKKVWYNIRNNPINCDCGVKWISGADDMRIVLLDGTCAAPHHLKERKLKELKKEDFNYCT